MLKVIGCALLILSGSAAGWYMGEKPVQRHRLLGVLTELVKETSVMLGAYIPTESIMESLRTTERYSALGFLHYDICDAADKQRLLSEVSRLPLESGTADRLRHFFSQLGSSEMEQERTRAELLYTYLKAELERTDKTFRSQRKLCRALGILSGAFAAVMLI